MRLAKGGEKLLEISKAESNKTSTTWRQTSGGDMRLTLNVISKGEHLGNSKNSFKN